MAEYDPNVIRRYADTLYEQAGEVVRSATLAGLVLGAAAGGAAGAALGPVPEYRVVDSYPTGPAVIARPRDTASGVGGIVGAVFLGAGAALIARARAQVQANALRLQAQTALCQVAIELNTRLAAEAARRA